jgi:hypothetical protein
MADKKEKPAEVVAEKAPADIAAENKQVAAPAAPGTVETDGTRARRALMLKQFIPNPDWINKNIVAGGKGTQMAVGRIWGVATSIGRKQNTLPDGKIVDSIVVNGIFQAESYLTGELSEASSVYFPMAYAEKIAALFASVEGLKVVEVDCDVGLEATGKTIPYEWVIIAFREGEEMAVLKRIKGTRGRPTNAAPLALAGPAAVKQIAG